jgi:hypothetical protein
LNGVFALQIGVYLYWVNLFWVNQMRILDSTISRQRIGRKIKNRRRERQLSIGQLAIASGIPYRRLMRLELGERSLTLIEAGNLARQLECRIEELLHD